MKNKQHIKRCPMCGSKAKLWEDFAGRYAIECSNHKCIVRTRSEKNAK